MRRRTQRKPNPPVDTGMMGRALRGEIDTRIWSAYGNIVEDPVTDEYGYRVDVEIMTDTVQVVTARVWTPYAGPGFGLFMRLYKDDEVLVMFPGGDVNEAVVMPGLWSKDAPQPTLANGTLDEDEAAIAPEDYLLIVKPGTKMRIETSKANIELVSDEGVVVQAKNATVTATEKAVVDAPTIELGAGAMEDAVLGNALNTWLTSPTGLSVSTAFGPSGPAINPLVSGTQLSTTVKVK